MTTAIGIDVGERRIVGGLVHLENGDVLCRREILAYDKAPRGGGAAMASVLRAVEDLYHERCADFAHPSAIGLCICEDVDRAGRILSGRRVAWRGLPVRELLAQLAPAQVDTGVRACARAEARFGAGRGESSFVFAQVGATVRACLVIEGRPYFGFEGNAVLSGELPCTAYDGYGRPVRYLPDDVASIDALLHRCGVDKSEALFERAAQGDLVAAGALRTAGQALGAVLGHLCSALDPQSLVLGGEFERAPTAYWESLRSAVHAHMRNEISRRVPVHRALLSESGGIIGAALAAAEGAVIED
jgi:glucokinase